VFSGLYSVVPSAVYKWSINAVRPTDTPSIVTQYRDSMYISLVQSLKVRTVFTLDNVMQLCLCCRITAFRLTN
jgi:hypothetical protein